MRGSDWQRPWIYFSIQFDDVGEVSLDITKLY